MVRWKKVWKIGKRGLAGSLAVILGVSGMIVPVPVYGSNIWPQKSTAPFYCLDGGKSWKAVDRYEIYEYDTLPSALTDVQAKRLFWAYPSNWNALKEAAQKYDEELYASISAISSGPNIVKKVKDDPASKFAWVADNSEIENRAIQALEKMAAETAAEGNDVPEMIKDATSEDHALSIVVPAFNDGPSSLNTEFQLGTDFVSDIAKIEIQSVWDNGATGGSVGWVDASQEKNLVESVMGDSLYEITWSGDSIQIHNNGSAVANENAIGSTMSEEERYNKTTVLYKITMRENSGWYTEGRWNEDYLHEWMDFKACINAPAHQRLYMADIRIVPSDLEFYLVISQGESAYAHHVPEYGEEKAEVSFQVYKHEETFESTYRVKMKKLDDETNMPLKGSQFYLYERFDSKEMLGGSEEDGKLNRENLSFQEWDGFQIFSEGTTDENGELIHTDSRNYIYSKTYCDGHALPKWVEGEDSNREAADKWMELVDACSAEAESSGGKHFHWLLEEDSYDEVQQILETGKPGEGVSSEPADAQEAFERSGCEADCRQTYENFIHLRFSYTWREVQARTGYILHGIHTNDHPIEIISTIASEAGAEAVLEEGDSWGISEHIWYAGSNEAERQAYLDHLGERKKMSLLLNDQADAERKTYDRTASNAEERIYHTSASNAEDIMDLEDLFGEIAEGKSGLWKRNLEYEEEIDEDWEENETSGNFLEYLWSAEFDDLEHLPSGNSDLFSYADTTGGKRDCWVIKNHRTEGEIHMNKRDMDLYCGEDENYSSYGDNEGDAVLAGAVYGLFAAEDILHPDSDLLGNETYTNTGIVYKKHDLVSVSKTDAEGNASFFTYSVAPGRTYDYELQEIVVRTDENWSGPMNRYEENMNVKGNWWIDRPLILGKYYIKELSRSEGYELSVNGKTGEWTNYGTGFDTPDAVADTVGMAVVTMPELSAAMEGYDEGGEGYDELTFSVTSAGTSSRDSENEGYELLVTGLPEGTQFYRVDSGEMEITGPRIVGTEEKVMTDDQGNIIWKTAKSDRSYLKYEPEYDKNGALIGQKPMVQMEAQQLTAEQIPEAEIMEITDWSLNVSDPIWNELAADAGLGTQADANLFLKAELEAFLRKNGYGVPTTAAGTYSTRNMPIYNIGVLKGEKDVWGLTTAPMNIAEKTVYGAAIQEVWIDLIDADMTIYELFASILSWYVDHPQWSYGGIHEIALEGERCKVTLYADVSDKISRRFFTRKSGTERIEVENIYAVYENPQELRWIYQEYGETGIYQYQIERKYYYGSGAKKRYYIDAVLTPAMMVDLDGNLQPVEHPVMVYHKAGEEIIDYLSGDPDYGYRVSEKIVVDKVELTTEKEMTEQDVLLEDVRYDGNTGVYRIKIKSTGTDCFGQTFSDENGRLTLSFSAKLPKKKTQLKQTDIEFLGTANMQGYQVGDEIGYAEYLMRFQGAAISVITGKGSGTEDTFIVSKTLAYRGQYKIEEDGDTGAVPVQVLERPIKQKVKVVKQIEGEEAIGNFRFKLYLKANLERLFCSEAGEIIWLDQFGDPVDIWTYKKKFPELVQNLYTKQTERPVLETIKRVYENEEGIQQETEGYNYEKFFDAIETANIDKWKAEHPSVKNTSWKPAAKNRLTGVENQINSSDAAKENAKRSDAVRQFAVTWYLEQYIEEMTAQYKDTEDILTDDMVQAKDGEVRYSDELYDEALYRAILDAERYLTVFFQYDLDTICAICWDSEENGGIDEDTTTLSADQLEMKNEKAKEAYGVSPYLPYGEYVLREQQPYCPEWYDFPNRHYEIDTPKEISLPVFYNEQQEKIYASQVPWSMTEPGEKKDMSGYASPVLVNRRYGVTLRAEKIDEETGEPILHSGAVFALYKAERDESPGSDGKVKRYEEKTLIFGSKVFLEAMGAAEITPFERNRLSDILGRSIGNLGAGVKYSGWVPAGTPICKEADCIVFSDTEGIKTGDIAALSTVNDRVPLKQLQITGFFETPEKVEAGIYVLAELLPPDGYVRSMPVAVEVYSDSVVYELNENKDRVTAIRYGDWKIEEGVLYDADQEYARLWIQNTPTSLSISKIESLDSSNRMKISGRVEGSISALKMIYGLENLELAYNSTGAYLGFGWKKGTMEYLENRKMAGERVELVYENGIFQGYGYVIREKDTIVNETSYVPGATMALFKAIEIHASGDTEDFSWKGIQVSRDDNGNVESIVAKSEYTGEEIPVLFYDLGKLKVLETSADGRLFGYDRSGQKVQVTFDTKSIFAIRDGRAEFEITGGDFSQLVYEEISNAFVHWDEDTIIYHLDENMVRDALVDPYTGLAYVENMQVEDRDTKRIFVWPVTEWSDQTGKVVAKEKILTGRPGEKNSGTEQAYITGSVVSSGAEFDKMLNPVYNRHGLTEFYPVGKDQYKKGNAWYDRDGEYIGFKYDDLLELYNQAAFGVLDPPALYGVSDSETEDDPNALYHRQGESWIIPNIWVSGEETPQDPSDHEMTNGCADILKRVVPGCYIMEELKAPDGYVKAFPAAVSVEEIKEIQKVSIEDERTKIEIAKIDGTDSYKKAVYFNNAEEVSQYGIEGTSAYSGEMIAGAKLALYKARKVYTTDYGTYPKGYYLEKTEQTPASWYLNDFVENEPVLVEAVWITGESPKYFEGIPVGDYILEELDTPEGYIPASMEITVQAVPELQSFILKNDHTKLEIYKYIIGEDQTKDPLRWPDEAAFALYPAVLDADGKPVTANGAYLHEVSAVSEWKTGGQLEYAEDMMWSYESMYAMYGSRFQVFSWESLYEGNPRSISANLVEERTTPNREIVTQIWELEDRTKMRVTVVVNDGKSKKGSSGVPEPVFEYQFNYNGGKNTGIPDMVSYDLYNGIHRIDRIPAGDYVLVEEKTPEGYMKAEPILISVRETEQIQRVYVENKPAEKEKPTGTLIIEKRGREEGTPKLSGALFEVKNLQNGEVFRVVTDDQGQASLKNLPIAGEYASGVHGPVIYEIREITAPEGYRRNHTVWQIRFRDDGNQELVHHMVVTDEQTQIGFSKQIFSSNHFLSGARFAVYEARLQNGEFEVHGEALERWISTEEPHMVVGKLSGGKTYILVEEAAPEGYTKAAPVRFTIAEDGSGIVELSESFMQIQITYREDQEAIETISVTGCAAIGHQLELLADDESLLICNAAGKEILWRNELENVLKERDETIKDYTDMMMNIRGKVSFADGGGRCISQEYFYQNPDSGYQMKSSGAYPVGTEYTLRTEEGIVLERWSVKVGTQTHVMVNEENQDGRLRFEAGRSYELEECVVFQDGSRWVSDSTTISLGPDGNMEIVHVDDRETEVRVRKLDMTTGKELPGAILTIRDDNQVIADQWISETEAHIIHGILVPGETYCLTETMAADGFSYARDMVFTLHETGCMTTVYMEDRPTHVEIHKTDLATGEELPGAELLLKDAAGNVVDQWISSTSPHVIKGTLIAGETYTLLEEVAPEGYLKAEEVVFTVSMDGKVDRITMEDSRKSRKEDLKEPDGTVPAKKPETEEKKQYGTITASYNIDMNGQNMLRLRIPDHAKITIIPQTGDESYPALLILTALLSLTGIAILLWMRRKEHGEEINCAADK